MSSPDLSRVLILATHPDDDVIGSGGLIQHVLAGRGCVRVLFMTSGESNDWAHRAMVRKWRITPADRIKFASVRRAEAKRGLQLLGVPLECARFLEYSDQHLWRLAHDGDLRPTYDLVAQARDFAPTLVVSTSFFDLHPDHRATAWYAHQAFTGGTAIATYLVHGSPPTMRTQFTVQLTPEEQEKKRAAIACHRSQLVLSRHRFLAYARATETFYAPEYDVARVDTPGRERVASLRHAATAILGAMRH